MVLAQEKRLGYIKLSQSPALYFHIRSKNFPHIDGEYPGDVFEGDYFIGKSLCQYLQAAFDKRGYEETQFDWEDWGWWFGFKGGQLAIYCVDHPPAIENYAVMNMAKPQVFSLRYFSKVENPKFIQVNETLKDIFENDGGITLVSIADEYPL